MNRKVTMAGVESSEGRKGHEEKAIRMTLEFPYARQLGKGRAFFFFLICKMEMAVIRLLTLEGCRKE